MTNELSETYKIIEDLCDVNLGVGDKHLLMKIIECSQEKRLKFSSDGAQYIIREFLSFFPNSDSFQLVLERISKHEKNALKEWRRRYLN